MAEIFEERLERSASEAQALTDAIGSSSLDARRNTRAELEELALVAQEHDLEDVFVAGLIHTIVSMKSTSPIVANRYVGQGE
jgi:hypothetical protein